MSLTCVLFKTILSYNGVNKGLKTQQLEIMKRIHLSLLAVFLSPPECLFSCSTLHHLHLLLSSCVRLLARS